MNLFKNINEPTPANLVKIGLGLASTGAALKFNPFTTNYPILQIVSILFEGVGACIIAFGK